jgi:hypothetical protein
VLTYDFRLPPGPRTVEHSLLAEELGFRAVWCPEIPAFGHDIWVTLARIAEKTKRLKFGPSVLIPSYRHPMAQASAIATLEQMAPGRLMVGFGTGFTGRAGMGKKPLTLADVRTHIAQVKALLRGDIADIDGGLAQILASDGWLPDRPIDVPVYMASQSRTRHDAEAPGQGRGGRRRDPVFGLRRCLLHHRRFAVRGRRHDGAVRKMQPAPMQSNLDGACPHQQWPDSTPSSMVGCRTTGCAAKRTGSSGPAGAAAQHEISPG